MGELYPDNFERLTTPEPQNESAGGCDHGPEKENIFGADERPRRLIIYGLPFTCDDDDRRESLLSGEL